MAATKTTIETATLGGGCFWCLEPIFQQLQGVNEVHVGYAGGHVENPTYEAVCTGSTGHAEVVQVHFDPEIISFKEILEVFFSVHDPTTLNRQGADIGTQYRSAIFTHSEAQKQIAESWVEELKQEKSIVTEIAPISNFYKAENYHQEYFERNGNAPYCRLIIAPKIDKFKKAHGGQLK